MNELLFNIISTELALETSSLDAQNLSFDEIFSEPSVLLLCLVLREIDMVLLAKCMVLTN